MTRYASKSRWQLPGQEPESPNLPSASKLLSWKLSTFSTVMFARIRASRVSARDSDASFWTSVADIPSNQIGIFTKACTHSLRQEWTRQECVNYPYRSGYVLPIGGDGLAVANRCILTISDRTSPSPTIEKCARQRRCYELIDLSHSCKSDRGRFIQSCTFLASATLSPHYKCKSKYEQKLWYNSRWIRRTRNEFLATCLGRNGDRHRFIQQVARISPNCQGKGLIPLRHG